VKSTDSSITITPVYQVMPRYISTKIEIPASLLSSRILFPFGISFFIPLFVYTLTLEKQSRIFIMMRMNGLKSWTYFLAHYVDFFLSAILSMSIFLLIAAAIRLEIVSINPGPIIIILTIWINTAISLSFAISTLFGNARNALVGTFLVLLMSIVISIAATAIWNNDPPSPYFIWPPFACYTAVGIINSRAVSLDAPALTTSTMGDGGKLFLAIYYLLVEWVAFFLIAIYGHVIPSII
jgi:hypothetical protein